MPRLSRAFGTIKRGSMNLPTDLAVAATLANPQTVITEYAPRCTKHRASNSVIGSQTITIEEGTTSDLQAVTTTEVVPTHTTLQISNHTEVVAAIIETIIMTEDITTVVMIITPLFRRAAAMTIDQGLKVPGDAHSHMEEITTVVQTLTDATITIKGHLVVIVVTLNTIDPRIS